MHLAVFTNEFPARINTFFARDLRALVDSGITVDVFPFYPLNAQLWQYVPSLLAEGVLPRDRVHHLRLADLRRALRRPLHGTLPFLRDALRIVGASARYGPLPATKSMYVAAQAWLWTRQQAGVRYDHVLAYWGNYSASCAYLFHQLATPGVPYSMFTHARVDLYRHPAFLRAKLLYADNIFLVCEFNRRYLAEHYSDIFSRIAPKLFIHHLGVDLREFEFRANGRPANKLLAVTRFERHKGLHNLLRAVASLRAKGLPVELDVIGGGEEGSSLASLAAELKLGSVVTFRGWVRPEEVRHAMRSASLFVHAPLGEDAMPTVIKEALASGIPVVGSRTAGIPELLADGRCGTLVPPDDVPALTNAIAALLADPALRHRYAEAGRRHAEDTYDLAKNGPKFAARLIATRRPTT
jgi:glycosyltransferase involved in cell wall biosynthesis